MKNFIKEITQIILGIILMVGGLALVLMYGKYLDGRGLLGLFFMGSGILIFIFFVGTGAVSK